MGNAPAPRLSRGRWRCDLRILKSFPAAGANPRRCLYYFLGHVELLNFYGPLKSSATTHTSPCALPGFTHEVMSSWHPLFQGSAAYAELADDLHARGLE